MDKKIEPKKIKIGKKEVVKVEAFTNKLLELMGTKAKATANHDKENEAIRVNIAAKEEAGLLIGHRGETLNAIQSVLGMMLRNKSEGWARVIIDIDGWRDKQEDQLKEIAVQTAQKARETGESQNLYNLSPSQRRLVHIVLSEEKDIATQSEGEGEERYLVVSPKK